MVVQSLAYRGNTNEILIGLNVHCVYFVSHVYPKAPGIMQESYVGVNGRQEMYDSVLKNEYMVPNLDLCN